MSLHVASARHHFRARFAGVALCALWILGFEIAPNIHLAVHSRLAVHSHGHEPAPGAQSQDGPRITVTFAEHSHGTVSHSHDGPEPLEPHTQRDAGERIGDVEAAPIGSELIADLPLPLDHGAHSIAHRGIASLVPQPVLAPPMPARAPTFVSIRTTKSIPRSRRPLTIRGRGPPAA